MRTTLDIPDEVAGEVQRRADRDGRELVEQIVLLVRTGLLAADVPAADLERFARAARPAGSAPGGPADVGSTTRGGTAHASRADPVTGLPVIDSPPGAPVYGMRLDEVLALARDAESENDLERTGLPVRH